MMEITNHTRTTAEKIQLFRSFFTGLPNVYGTYNPDTGRSWQEKKHVTSETILAHLKGKKHYGVYLLVKDTIRAIAADFDHHDPTMPLEFIQTARHYRLLAYLEVSKSKGFHAWVFFPEKGVKAYKARLVIKLILDQIEASQTEVFPKQDFLDSRAPSGNFIYTPLFGQLVPEGKTVFVDPVTLKPFENQWDFLESIQRVEEGVLDEIIEINSLSLPNLTDQQPDSDKNSRLVCNNALPLCIQNILQNGVSRFQRSLCFRLSVQLRRVGLPYDATVSVLKIWSLKNKPEDNKRIINDQEIIEQSSCAYRKEYKAYGCETPEMAPFCHAECHLFAKRKREKL